VKILGSDWQFDQPSISRKKKVVHTAMVVAVEMDHGRLKHWSQTPFKIPAKVTSVSPTQQKESSLRFVSASPRERLVNTPVVSGSAKNA
jgi:hypothetical protein